MRTNPVILPPLAGRARFPRGAIAVAAVLALAACGGGGGDLPTGGGGAPVAPSLSGAVAVGAPISDGRVRVLDAAGTVVAADIVVAADGSYTVPELTGTGPWRIEACGNVGATWQCIYSVAQAPGTANVTPLTTAAMLLATGQSPEQLMGGSAVGLTADALDAAQTQLRAGLAPVLAASDVPANLDFFGGSLSAGTRTGYDRVLDSVGVATGVDGQPFVQITPRLGEGNLYLQQGSSSGSVQVDASAASLSLEGLEGLFREMSAAMSSARNCTDDASGLARSMASGARLFMDGQAVEGPSAVAATLCSMMDQEQMFPARLLSPVLGRCDLGGAAPVCRVGFVLSDGQGGAQAMGARMGVTYESGAWKFLGDLDPIELYASATVQRDRRIDGTTPVDRYARALAFDIAAVDGLQCARIVQRDAQQQPVTVAYFKRFDGEGVRRLSLWTENGQGWDRSLDPARGALRSRDDTWVALPEGEAGDEVVRNFFRGGRTVTVQLFGDAACSTAMQVGGRSSFELEIEGVPPVWSRLPELPWPELTDASRQAFVDLRLEPQSVTALDLAWTFPRGPMGLGEASFCLDRATCGEGGEGRVGEARIRAGGASVGLTLRTGAAALQAGAPRTLALFGRGADGLQVQSNHQSCSARPAGQACDE